MKIATFNANSIRQRMDVILRWLAENEPDALCIQETKVQDQDFPHQPIEDAGYHVTFKGEKAYNGVALISRTAPTEVSFGLDDVPHDAPRLLHAKVGPVHIVNTYVPQGREIDNPMYQYKLEWFARLRRYFERHFKKSVMLLWTGDLNVAAEPIDVHSPELYGNHVCFHAAAREAFANCRAWGFVDVFRKYHPEPGQFTFFDYRTPNAVQRGIGWRIDYLLASPALAKTSAGGAIDVQPRLGDKPSDHAFLSATFEL
jgi:exodeoxyribonuclease III